MGIIMIGYGVGLRRSAHQPLHGAPRAGRRGTPTGFGLWYRAWCSWSSSYPSVFTTSGPMPRGWSCDPAASLVADVHVPDGMSISSGIEVGRTRWQTILR